MSFERNKKSIFIGLGIVLIGVGVLVASFQNSPSNNSATELLSDSSSDTKADKSRCPVMKKFNNEKDSLVTNKECDMEKSCCPGKMNTSFASNSECGKKDGCDGGKKGDDSYAVQTTVASNAGE